MRWVLAAMLLPACDRLRSDPLGDAGWYAAALAEQDYDAAARACRRIDDADSREDCLLAAMEANNRLVPADCVDLEVPKWHEECLFMLAERQSHAGDLPLALHTCETSRFARSCTWHLLQDFVQGSLEQPVPQAERALDAFQNVHSLPDAAYQFWVIRLREGGALGRPVDEADCNLSREPMACRRAVEAHVRRILDALGRASRATVCKAEPGKRAMTRGKPAWLPGPITSASEAAWVGERCR